MLRRAYQLPKPVFRQLVLQDRLRLVLRPNDARLVEVRLVELRPLLPRLLLLLVRPVVVRALVELRPEVLLRPVRVVALVLP